LGADSAPVQPLRRQLLRFGLAGVLGLGVDTAALYGLMALGMPFVWARALSFVAAASFTWAFNRSLTFAERTPTPPTWGEWGQYLLAMAVGGVVNYVVSVASYRWWPIVQSYPVLALALGSAVGMVFNFVSARFWVFGRAR
jgi:putative flippase GtrA